MLFYFVDSGGGGLELMAVTTVFPWRLACSKECLLYDEESSLGPLFLGSLGGSIPCKVGL